MTQRHLWTLMAVLFSAGCSFAPDAPSGVFACDDDSDCPRGQSCVGSGDAARCIAQGTPDAGVDGGGSNDGGVDTGAPDAGPPPIETGRDLFESYIASFCALDQSCGHKYPSGIGTIYCSVFSNLPPEVESELALLDSIEATPLAQETVDDFRAAIAECTIGSAGLFSFPLGVLQGPNTLGAGCDEDFQCATGYCQDDTEYACGVCAAIPTSLPCSFDSDCADDQICNESEVCVAAPSAPDPCISDQCASDSFCNEPAEPGGTRFCTRRPGLNMSCRRTAGATPLGDDPCLGVFVCTRLSVTEVDMGDPIEEWACREGVGEGGTCEMNVTPCAQGLRCVNDTCIVPAGEGEACITDGCVTPLYCIGGFCQDAPDIGDTGCGPNVPCLTGVCASGACVPATVPGPCGTDGPFDSGERCSDGYCDGGNCRAFVPTLGDCSSGERCVEEAYCSGGVCLLKLIFGSPCSIDDQCARDTDGHARCVEGFCRRAGQVDEACEGDWHCEDDLRCVGAEGSRTCANCAG